MSGDNPQNEFPPNAGQVPPPKDNPYGDTAGVSGVMPPKPGMEIDSDSRNMAMLAHLLGALLGFIGPLIIWLVKKDESPFVDDQGKEALNFQLTLLIAYFISIIVLTVSCGIIFFAPFVPMVLQLVFGIIGATTANKGEYYRYPMTIRMIK